MRRHGFHRLTRIRRMPHSERGKRNAFHWSQVESSDRAQSSDAPRRDGPGLSIFLQPRADLIVIADHHEPQGGGFEQQKNNAPVL